ncbi:MAG: hypothetical protein KBT39_00270 [Bacteroidales bacterium]|nr:hypothetical protein [Bacteroidales bacterium]
MADNGLFEEGKVLYFDPFYFKDKVGGQKPKYYIVLKKQADEVVLATLPTSKDFVPSTIEKAHGCIDHPEINFNCYYFAAGQAVCTNGFGFPVETYVYGYRLQTHRVADFVKQAADGETVITERGQLTDEEYRAIVDCLRMSPAVKRVYRNALCAN